MSLATESLPVVADDARRSRPTLPRPTIPRGAAFVGAAIAFVGISFAAGAPSPLFVLYQREWHFAAWVLTVAFAIYAVGLLLALLVAGSLSDHIGRRPVLVGAMALQLASMLMFFFAQDIAWVIVARAIQGIATGAAMSAISAAVTELAPPRRARFGTLLTSLAPTAGLSLGALSAGVAVQFSTVPSIIIFGFLTALFLFGTVIAFLAPETISRRPGAARSLIPRLSVARAARPEFAAAVPVHVATWMLAGLVLGLAPSIDSEVFHVNSGLVNGVIVALQPGAAAVASLLSRRLEPRRAIIGGTVAALAGVSVLLVSILTGFFPLMFLGTVVGGAGFGLTFSGALRLVTPLTEAHQRAELFAGVYLVSYLAYGIPALVAGETIGLVGLLPTVLGYTGLILVVAAVGLATQAARARAAAATPRELGTEATA